MKYLQFNSNNIHWVYETYNDTFYDYVLGSPSVHFMIERRLWGDLTVRLTCKIVWNL